MVGAWLVWWAVGAVMAVTTTTTRAQCPWDQHQQSELQSSCICAYNAAHQLSVQCDVVDFQLLLRAFEAHGRGTPLDLLYINNSTVKSLAAGTFKSLRLTNLQMSGCRIRAVAPGAFDGLQSTLKNLYLQDNELEEIPVEALRGLKNLTTLDLSKNRFTRVTDSAFSTLTSLATLKLSDNNLTIARYAFRGLEGSLKNLNLKGTKQKRVPDAVRGLRTLAFLDLAQNGLRELPGPGGSSTFEGLRSLTALNLERNVIQTVGDETFLPVSRTLSSLSLLNNLLTDFPTAAISVLTELRVLDIGFNLVTELPRDAFLGNPSLTLLALDGNPLSTVPGVAVAHLNNSLRGLSLGGRFLHCDCRLRWVAQWVRRGDLQVTSRERNPQYCGSPPKFTEKNFYNIEPEELVCTNERPGLVSMIDEDPLDEEESLGFGEGVGFVEPETTDPPATKPTSSTTTTTTTTAPVDITVPSTTSPTTTTVKTTTSSTTTPEPVTQSTTTQQSGRPSNHRGNNGTRRPPTGPAWPHRPPLVLGSKNNQDVIVRQAHRQDNSVVIQWDSETANILGFRVVYRLFGDKAFKQGPPLDASEREFKIKNVPSQECIVVCVVSLEEVSVTPESVPYNQCREVRTANSPTNNMDKITIAASAAICGTVVIAVIVFVAASRRRSRKLHTLDGSLGGGKGGGLALVGGLPVACCPASSPGPMSSLAQLNAFTTHKDWDNVSVYSNRSLARPRMSYVDRQSSITGNDEVRSHFSTKAGSKTRSIADGQSQHSYSNSSGRYLSSGGVAGGGNGFSSSCLVNSRPELRQSRQSLAISERMSRTSYPNGGGGGGGRGEPGRRRSRSTRESTGMRPGSRYSQAGSTHTLNYCGDTSDNWTDHDMDIYTTRNPTARSGLVPL